jgi:hypothetical protein
MPRYLLGHGTNRLHVVTADAARDPAQRNPRFKVALCGLSASVSAAEWSTSWRTRTCRSCVRTYDRLQREASDA